MMNHSTSPKNHDRLRSTSTSRRRNATLQAAACLLIAAAASGCGSDDTQVNELDASGPLYAIMYEVYDDNGSNSYLSILDTLDIEEIDTTQAREIGGGRAFIQTYGGKLFVGDAESPTVTRYALGEKGELIPEGNMSFVNYFPEGQFDSWNVTFISPEKAYLMDFNEGRTILWNPATLEILGDIPPAPEFFREGLSLEGTPGVVRDGLLFRTFDWVNYDDATYSTDILLGIYDVQTDQLVDLVSETRCPVPGNLVHQDEAGNIYFSNWIWPVAGTLMRGAPESCVLRINAGETRFDPTWTLSYPDYTEGRKGAMFSYLEDNQALMAAFYDERTSFEPTTDPWSYVGSNNWRIWSADLATNTAAPIEGIDFNGGAFTPIRFDDRLFVMVPGGEEVRYATQLYEIADGSATPFVKLPGWSYQFIKLR